jgi:hypothetical protein
MKNFLIILFLTGCTTALPPVVRVEIPVSVPCVIAQIDKPSFAVDALPVDPPAGMKRSDFVWLQMNALRADRIQRQAYEKILEAAIQACQK